jgi:hypothetical protein
MIILFLDRQEATDAQGRFTISLKVLYFATGNVYPDIIHKNTKGKR